MTIKAFYATFLIFLAVPLFGQNTVWQIGKFDGSSAEFAAHQSKNVIYQVATNDWAKVWPGEERGQSSYEVGFNLKRAPQGTYTLRISALTYSPRIPALKISVNGHEGIFYLNPKLSYDLGDQPSSVFDAHYSSNELYITVPAALLKNDQNALVLSCVNTEPPYDQHLSEGELHGAINAVHYDALSFTYDSGPVAAEQSVQAHVTPSVFYRMKAGHLVEDVDAILRFGGATPAGVAVLTLAGHKYTLPVEANAGFGEQHLTFEVSEWSGAAAAKLELSAGNQPALNLSLTPARKWTVFVVPHTHVDVGFTDYQGKVAEVQARTLDEAKALIKQYPDFRFTTDGSWNLEQFLTRRSSEDRDEVLSLIRQGKIGVPAQYLNLVTGYASLETLYRSLYYSRQLSLKHNLPFNYANATDVPTYSGAYPSILASSGIKYWVAGGNNMRAPILSHEAWNEKSPFYWEGPDGKKVLFWYSRGYSQVMFMFGLPPEQAAVHESLPIFLQAYDKASYKPNVALIYGTQPENTILYPETATFATEFNKTYAYPKLVYSTFPDFFHYIDLHYGKDLPTYKGDMGGYWEDGAGADAVNTAKNRQNENSALAAEILSTVAHQASPIVNPPKQELMDAWKNMVLFAEHTWTASVAVKQPDSEESVGQLAVKDNYATQASFDLVDVSNAALSQLANQIHVPGQTLVVFNPLSWRRDAIVETDLLPNDDLVEMKTNLPVPIYTIDNLKGINRVRFLAVDLPAVGYKCYQIRVGKKTYAQKKNLGKNPIIENQYYRVTVDAESGAIKSIYDKQLQRELVDTGSPYKFGQYLYVTGGDGKTRMIKPFKTLPLAELTIHHSSHGEYKGTEKMPWGDRIRLHSSDVNTPSIDTEISMYDNEKKIEFNYKVHKEYTTAKEGVYFAFPVAVREPKFAYATQQGWVDPSRDMFKGASLEWFNVQGWMAALDSKMAVSIVPLDASLASFGDINRGEWLGEFHPKTSTIFSYVMNNYWDTNFRAGQGGDFTFRYVLTSADHLDTLNLARLSAESMEPIEIDHVVHQDKVGDPVKPLPAEGASFLDVKAPNVELVTWKMAEDGKGTILRLREVAGLATDTSIKVLHSNFHSAMLCNGVEDNIENLNVDEKGIHLKFHPYEVLTVRVLP